MKPLSYHLSDAHVYVNYFINSMCYGDLEIKEVPKLINVEHRVLRLLFWKNYYFLRKQNEPCHSCVHIKI